MKVQLNVRINLEKGGFSGRPKEAELLLDALRLVFDYLGPVMSTDGDLDRKPGQVAPRADLDPDWTKLKDLRSSLENAVKEQKDQAVKWDLTKDEASNIDRILRIHLDDPRLEQYAALVRELCDGISGEVSRIDR